jgi:hypothetical protein
VSTFSKTGGSTIVGFFAGLGFGAALALDFALAPFLEAAFGLSFPGVAFFPGVTFAGVAFPGVAFFPGVGFFAGVAFPGVDFAFALGVAFEDPPTEPLVGLVLACFVEPVDSRGFGFALDFGAVSATLLRLSMGSADPSSSDNAESSDSSDMESAECSELTESSPLEITMGESRAGVTRACFGMELEGQPCHSFWTYPNGSRPFFFRPAESALSFASFLTHTENFDIGPSSKDTRSGKARTRRAPHLPGHSCRELVRPRHRYRTVWPGL